MQFTKLDEPSLRANKISETGAIYYACWVDENGDEYVQIERNVGGGGKDTGSFSADLYRLSHITGSAYPVGFDPLTGLPRATSNTNMPAFLKAIKKDVDRRRSELPTADE